MNKTMVRILRKDSIILKYKDALLGNFYYEDIRPEIIQQ
jgi:hypothetical protein